MSMQYDAQSVQEALQHGRLSIPNESGYYRSMHANCPKDGTRTSVYMVERHGEAITRVLFHCPTCDTHFEAPPQDIFLA